jgi:hypothetical protein
MSGLANCIPATSFIMLSSRKIRTYFCTYVVKYVLEIILSYIATTEFLIQEQESGIQKSVRTGLFKPTSSQVCQCGS